VDVVERGGIGIATRDVGTVKIGDADSGAVAFVVAPRDYGGFVEAFEYIIRYY
jgi:hypothetical protein